MIKRIYACLLTLLVFVSMVARIDAVSPVSSAPLLFNTVTPAQITGIQNDYNPGARAYYLRLSSSASWTVNNLTFTGGQIDGETHVILNAGGNDLVFAHNAPTGTGVNSFLTPDGVPITVFAGKQVTIWYDAAATRWRITKQGF